MTDLQPLQTLRVDASPPKSPGIPPRMEWLILSALRVDPSYQRPIAGRGVRNILRIVSTFDWSRFSPLIVAPVPDAKLYTIIDGQHRATAALICGYDRVLCSIVDVQPGEAARIFAAVNGNVTPMSPLSLFKAARVAGEPWAKAIDRACSAAGIEPLVYPVSRANMKPRQTQSVGTLRQLVDRFGEDVLTAALVAETKLPRSAEPGYFGSDRLRAVVDDYRQSKTEGPTPERAHSKADRIRELKGRGFSRQAIASALGVTYAEIEEAIR